MTLNFNARGPNSEATREFEECASNMYRNLNARLPAIEGEKRKFRIKKVKLGRIYSKLDWMAPPKEEVLKRLTAELGSCVSEYAVMNPRGNDFEILEANFLKVRDFKDPVETESEEDEEDEAINPSDFVQVEQK